MKYLTLWALLCILFGCGGTSQEEPPKKPSKIIFGYLQYEQLPEYQIPWDQLTHLSIAFGRALAVVLERAFKKVAWLMPPTSKSFCPSSAKGKRKG